MWILFHLCSFYLYSEVSFSYFDPVYIYLIDFRVLCVLWITVPDLIQVLSHSLWTSILLIVPFAKQKYLSFWILTVDLLKVETSMHHTQINFYFKEVLSPGL